MSQHYEAEMAKPDEGNLSNLQDPRVREVFKYLPEWASRTETSHGQTLTPSPDVTLNSFVQLVALRLNVDKSLISLLDGEEQYILAEATKSSSIGIETLAAEGDHSPIGMRTVPCGQGLCQQALAQMPSNGILVVEDIHKQQQFYSQSFTQSMSNVKFYAACPIVINDQKVGILCAVDYATRQTLTTEETNFLSDISSATAQHLESVRMKKTHTRTAGIVGALDAVMRPGQRHPSFRRSSQVSKLAQDNDDLPVTPNEQVEAQSENPNLSLPANFLEYAGSLLVNGFDANGVIFYDAGSRFYTGGVSQNTASSKFAGQRLPLRTRETQEYISHLEASSQTDSPACEILAFSKGTKRSDFSVCIGCLQEQDLRCLFELFPTGRVIDAGNLELSLSDEGKDIDCQGITDPDYNRVLTHLRQAIPDAESIVFFPMWDHYRERWYAGGFLYSCDARRLVFTAEDFAFLQAFALVLTGELASRDRERSQSQKETFISMISHELRTPLHGILSNVDLMRDIGLTTFQTTLLDTISACGHSLMDIINHLIDRSTMGAADENFKKHHQLYQQYQRPSLRRATSFDNSEEVDLVVVAEEVISALTVEMHLRAEARQGYEEALYTSNPSETQDLLPSDAVVVYDIHPQRNWKVHVRKGAFRRLLSNLTSNAIKFTRHGTIEISLQRSETPEGSLACTITLGVVDTGEGISSDFMKHHLFQQFKQENTRTIGSGLGLFVVKSMADELQGKIDIQSTKGDGTLVSITFPCELVNDEPETEVETGLDYADPALQKVKDNAGHVVANFISLVGDERSADNKAGLDHSRESISGICRKWFGITVESSTKLKAGPRIVNFVDESFLDSKVFPDVLAEITRDLEWSDHTGTLSSPIVFIGTVNFTAALQKQSKFEAKANMFSITNPYVIHLYALILLTMPKMRSSSISTSSSSLSGANGKSAYSTARHDSSGQGSC